MSVQSILNDESPEKNMPNIKDEEETKEKNKKLLKSPITYPDICFGPNEWREYFGEVGDAPALPADIENILNGPCPYYQAAKLIGMDRMGKTTGNIVGSISNKYWIDKLSENKQLKVRDTHLLTLYTNKSKVRISIFLKIGCFYIFYCKFYSPAESFTFFS